MKRTICHPSVVNAIRAYLALTEHVLTGARVIDYMRLMHNVTPATASRTLNYLARRGEVTRPRRGLYQWGDR
jgi:hypothetical protein